MPTKPKVKKHLVYERNGRYLYPWFKMNVGDWFEVPSVKTCSAAAAAIHRTYNLRFSVKKQKDGTTRCYRVAV